MDSAHILTIVTVTYNAERQLGRTLDSVKRAFKALGDRSEIEYLIIDGGSRDNTLTIAESYDSLVSKVISEKDQGIYDAMNKGLALSSGRYIWFLNAGDEIFDETVLQNLVPDLKQNADILYSDAMIIREDGSEFGLRSQVTPHSLPQNLTWRDFALGMKVCHQAFIVKTDLAPRYDIHNFSADIDWEIGSLKAAKNVKYLPFVLCRYLMGGASIQNHRQSLIDRFKVLRKHFGLLPTLFNHFRIILRGINFGRNKGKYW